MADSSPFSLRRPGKPPQASRWSRCIVSICSRVRKTGSCSKWRTVDRVYSARRRNSPACSVLVFRWAFLNCSSEAVRTPDGFSFARASAPSGLEPAGGCATALGSLVTSLSMVWTSLPILPEPESLHRIRERRAFGTHPTRRDPFAAHDSP